MNSENFSLIPVTKNITSYSGSENEVEFAPVVTLAHFNNLVF